MMKIKWLSVLIGGLGAVATSFAVWRATAAGPAVVLGIDPSTVPLDQDSARLAVGDSPGLQASVATVGTANEVFIRWRESANLDVTVHDQHVAVSYFPTAVVSQNQNELLVAGKQVRTGLTLIEKIRLRGPSYLDAQLPGGGVERVWTSGNIVSRQIVYSSSDSARDIIEAMVGMRDSPDNVLVKFHSSSAVVALNLLSGAEATIATHVPGSFLLVDDHLTWSYVGSGSCDLAGGYHYSFRPVKEYASLGGELLDMFAAGTLPIGWAADVAWMNGVVFIDADRNGTIDSTFLPSGELWSTSGLAGALED